MSAQPSILNCHSFSLVVHFRCILFWNLNADEKFVYITCHSVQNALCFYFVNKETRFLKVTENYLFRSRTNWCDGIFSCVEQQQNKECCCFRISVEFWLLFPHFIRSCVINRPFCNKFPSLISATWENLENEIRWILFRNQNYEWFFIITIFRKKNMFCLWFQQIFYFRYNSIECNKSGQYL